MIEMVSALISCGDDRCIHHSINGCTFFNPHLLIANTGAWRCMNWSPKEKEQIII